MAMVAARNYLCPTAIARRDMAVRVRCDWQLVHDDGRWVAALTPEYNRASIKIQDKTRD